MIIHFNPHIATPHSDGRLPIIGYINEVIHSRNGLQVLTTGISGHNCIEMPLLFGLNPHSPTFGGRDPLRLLALGW